MNGQVNYDINVRFTDVGSLKKGLDDLSQYLNDLDSYGEAAINAVGGETTDIGAALKGGMVEVNKANITNALNGLSNLDDNFTQIQNIYKSANDSILDRIRNESGNNTN